MHRDPVSGRPVFVAPQRGGKPDDRMLVAHAAIDATAHDWCPFCAGNEHRTPPDVLRAPADPARPWHARIVPNAYPITTSPEIAVTTEQAAIGIHEVIIESPRHDSAITQIDQGAWQDVWHLCHRRLADLAATTSLAWATVFKNSGAKAGASLEHVHSQLVAIDVVPPVMAAELEAVRRDPGTFPSLIAAAAASGRIVAERPGVVAIVPPAPRQPYEVWLIAREPEPHFHATSPDQVVALADLTRDLAGRYQRLASGCHFNWWLHQAPLAGSPVPPGWHWHLEMLPRLSEFAGFEVGTGCHITTVSAAESARRLCDVAG